MSNGSPNTVKHISYHYSYAEILPLKAVIGDNENSQQTTGCLFPVQNEQDAQKTKTTVSWTSLQDSGNHQNQQLQHQQQHHQNIFSLLHCHRLLNSLCLCLLPYEHPFHYRRNISTGNFFCYFSCSASSISLQSLAFASPPAPKALLLENSDQVTSSMLYPEVLPAKKCSLSLVNQRTLLQSKKATELSNLHQPQSSSSSLSSASLSSPPEHSSSQPSLYMLPLPNEPPLLLKHPLLSTTYHHHHHPNDHYSPFHDVLGSILFYYFLKLFSFFLRPLAVTRDLGLLLLLYMCSLPSATHCDAQFFVSPRRLFAVFRQSIALVILIGTAFATVVECGPHERRLLKDLLKNYNVMERPVLNESESITIRFSVTLQQVIDIDEKNQQIITNMWLKMEWEDANLVWKPDDYGGVTNLRIAPDKVWRPDILMYNSADEKFDGTFHTNVVVLSNGTMLYMPPGIFKSTCKIDITWFPFDDQYCDLKFGSWTYQLDALDLLLTNKTGDLSSYIPNGEWVLLDLPGTRHEESYECCPSKYIDITYRVSLRRRTLYYGFNLIVPSMIISSMTLLSFTLPPDSGEKLTLGVTILLSMIVFLMQLAEIMPATSDSVSIVGSYFACIMVMVAFSVVMTVVVLNFHHRTTEQQQEMPRWIRNVICTWLPYVLFIKRPPELFKRYDGVNSKRANEPKGRTPYNPRDATNTIGGDPASRPNHHPGVSLVPLYDATGAPRAAEPTIAEMLLLREKITEYENLVEEANVSMQANRHRQGCPSVASNASLLSRSNTLVGNHVPYGGGQLVTAQGGALIGCTAVVGDLRHRGGGGSMPNKCPYSFTSYPPPPPHTHHFTEPALPGGDSGVGSSGADHQHHQQQHTGYLFSVLGHSDEPTTYARKEGTGGGHRRDQHNHSHQQQHVNCREGGLQALQTDPLLENSCCCCACSGSGAEQSAAFFEDVMTELRFITNRLRREDDLNDIIGEWKFAAIVIDRLCLIVFSTFAIISTAVCLLSAPHLVA